MKQNDRREVHIRPRLIDSENSRAETIVTYGEAYGVYATLRPSGGKVQAEIYGERLSYMLELSMDTYAAVDEKYGVCVYVPPESEPDYEITAIRHWPRHKQVIIEALS